jgi:hypothetical protein
MINYKVDIWLESGRNDGKDGNDGSGDRTLRYCPVDFQKIADTKKYLLVDYPDLTGWTVSVLASGGFTVLDEDGKTRRTKKDEWVEIHSEFRFCDGHWEILT